MLNSWRSGNGRARGGAPLAVTASLALTLLAARADAAAAPTLSVTPTANLVANQSVTVTGSGFPPNVMAVVGQCTSATPTQNTCGNLVFATTDASGNIGPLNVTVTTSINLRTCLAPNGACYISATALSEPSIPSVPISFALDGRGLTVTPSTELHDLQQVALSGTGLVPSVEFEVHQCRANRLHASDCGQPTFIKTDVHGAFLVELPAAYRPLGDEFACDTPGACVFIAAPRGTFAPTVTAPIAFRAMGTVQRGTLQLNPTSVSAGRSVQVTGQGWAPGAAVLLQHDEVTVAPVNPDGTFAATLVPSGFVGLTNCTLASSSCRVSAWDSRDPSTITSAPLSVDAASGPSITIGTRTPLVVNLPIRVQGSGFPPNRPIRVQQCPADEARPLCEIAVGGFSVNTDASGAFHTFYTLRNSTSVPGIGLVLCTAGPCELVVDAAYNSLPSTLRVPLTNWARTESVRVTSYYDQKWIPLLQQGVAASGSPLPALQRRGAAVYGWLLTQAGFGAAAPLHYGGSYSVTSSYSMSDYLYYAGLAAWFGYTLDELQRDGALIHSWVQAGRPPLPQ